ncbi:radical SAM family heme chaperone HemW [Bifidobacterium thermophilum]|uniref:radical SAM family heme chaperone HemW n=1 Tax=Bifidobacterium thermophilum TaxID=33905 RepID=UPI00309C43F5
MTFEVYIHVPFCLRRCGYCDFNTYTALDLGAGASRERYAGMAIREMESVARWQREHGVEEPAASSVFFGGGTPTILPSGDLVAMLQAVQRIWGLQDDAEITTEANPDTVDDAYIAELAQGGFNRISFGMQSAVPHVLRTLDRRHTPANVEAGIRAADDNGMRSSVDLIYGAPGESLEDWSASLDAAVSLGVNHISAYALTVAPHTKMGRLIASGRLPRPDDDDEAAKYEMAAERLSSAGLAWYEISNWARPGYESRHNLGYWRNADWAGIGPGAHSHYGLRHGVTVKGENGPSLSATRRSNADAGFRKTAAAGVAPADTAGNGLAQANAVFEAGNSAVGIRAWDILHPRAWAQSLQAGCVPWQGAEGISARADMEETLMLGLRLREGLDTSRFDGVIPADAWHRLEAEGLLTLYGARPGGNAHEPRQARAVPTLRGRLLNDVIIERLFDYLP